MNDVQKSWLTAGGILACLLFGYGGSRLRDSVDQKDHILADRDSSSLDGLVASRDAKVDIPAVEYYNQMVGLLKQYYVEPIGNDQKLAVGAVRGMVASLGDPQSLFMDPTEFKASMNRQKGIYEGIGVDLYMAPYSNEKTAPKGFVPPPEDAEEAVATMKVPRVVVGGVVPGSPADRAGMKVGDVIADIDGHWVIDQALIDKFRNMQELFNEKKIPYTQIEPFQRDMRSKIQRALLPLRAMDKLELGASGAVQVNWTHDGVAKSADLTKAATKMPAFSVEGGVIRLPITQASADELPSAIAGHSSVTIDLRNSPEGEFDALPSIVADLAPAGSYGSIEANRQDFPEPFAITKGNMHGPKITFLVDSSTRGPAEILALSLSSHNRATLSGSVTAGDVAVKQFVSMPDGSGYSLVTGKYRPYSPTGKSKVARKSSPFDSTLAFAARNQGAHLR